MQPTVSVPAFAPRLAGAMLPQTTHRAATTRTTLPLARVIVVWITALMAFAMDAGLVVSANTSLGVTSDVIGSVVVSTIQNNLEIGNRRLVVLQDLPDVAASNAPLVCGGLPAIVTRTPNIGPNGACFANSSQPDLKSNLSCTCLTYVTKTPTEWTFRLKPVTDKTEKAQPLALDELQDLEIDSTLIYGVAPTVQRLNVIGVADKPLSIELRASPIPGADTSNVALVIAATKATIKSVYVENMDFGDLEIKRNFVPSKLTNLTLRNCKLSTLSSDLLADMGRLQYLDLSQNSLPGVYQDITPDTCTASACPILSMNLSYNQIKTFPSYLLNLDNLNTLLLAGNPLANATIPAAVYTKMGELKQLEIDPFTGNCSNGTVKQVATATICVLNATTVTTPAPSQTSSSNTNSILMYAVIAGCLLVAVLIFLLVKRKSCSRETDAESDKEPLDAYFDNTLSYDETHATISASLLNDPIIITNRLPYKDLRVANCISKGGFGLVYSGVYNRRRVAIKKIRPDRAGDIKQIESFLKEICLIATLNHPRIVEFIGVSWDTLRNLCAVTEFMDRGDLREVLHGFKLRNTPLTWETHKTSISLHIAEGLTYLHSLSPKIVHRDLKSKNVLLNNEMVAKLSDFGISRERHIEETHMTAGIGTSFWIAPEVLLGKDYDERADIFSFGVVLSEIDTDDYPYWNASNPNVGNKAQENMILQMVASGAMRPSFSDTCPRAILELADLCLQVEPSNRPTAAEVAYKLQQIMQFMNPSSGSGKHVV